MTANLMAAAVNLAMPHCTGPTASHEVKANSRQQSAQTSKMNLVGKLHGFRRAIG